MCRLSWNALEFTALFLWSNRTILLCNIIYRTIHGCLEIWNYILLSCVSNIVEPTIYCSSLFQQCCFDEATRLFMVYIAGNRGNVVLIEQACSLYCWYVITAMMTEQCCNNIIVILLPWLDNIVDNCLTLFMTASTTLFMLASSTLFMTASSTLFMLATLTVFQAR